jgi:hypothetical protein
LRGNSTGWREQNALTDQRPGSVFDCGYQRERLAVGAVSSALHSFARTACLVVGAQGHPDLPVCTTTTACSRLLWGLLHGSSQAERYPDDICTAIRATHSEFPTSYSVLLTVTRSEPRARVGRYLALARELLPPLLRRQPPTAAQGVPTLLALPDGQWRH